MFKIFRFADHQGKGQAYRLALLSYGWRESRYSRSRCAFGLSDGDWREEFINPLLYTKTPVFLYPHAARPMVQYDGIVTPKPVTAMFTIAEGGVELMKMISYPYPVEAVGWTYTEVGNFQPLDREPENILFAPIHPNNNGYLNQVDKDLNRKTFDALEKYTKKAGIKLKVRYLKSWELSGLPDPEEYPDVEWIFAKPNGSTVDIRLSDVIVAHQTFAYMSIAIGKPTLMFGEDIPPRSGNTEEGFEYVKNWDKYKNYLAYPLDILNNKKSAGGMPVAEWIKMACTTDEPIREWKQRFIGKPFNQKNFVQRLESYLQEGRYDRRD